MRYFSVTYHTKKMSFNTSGAGKPQKTTNYGRLSSFSKRIFTPAKNPVKMKEPNSVKEEKGVVEVIDISNSPIRKKEKPVDYNIPDRSKGDYYCQLCEAHMNTLTVWQTHVIGKRHLKNLEKGDGTASKQKFEYSKEKPVILDQLNQIKFPVVGLDHVTEFRRSSAADPTYTCFLCQGTQPSSQFIAHLLTTKHRLNYIKQVDPEGEKMITALHLKGGALDNVVEERAFHLAEKYGRGKIEVKVERKSEKKTKTYSKKGVGYRKDVSSYENNSRSPVNNRNWSPIHKRDSSPYYERNSSSNKWEPSDRRDISPTYERSQWRSPSPHDRSRSPFPHDRSRSPFPHRRSPPSFRQSLPHRRSPSPLHRNLSSHLQEKIAEYSLTRRKENLPLTDHWSKQETAFSKEDYLRRIDFESRSRYLGPIPEPAYGPNYSYPERQDPGNYNYRREEIAPYTIPERTLPSQFENFQSNIPPSSYQMQRTSPSNVPPFFQGPQYVPPVNESLQNNFNKLTNTCTPESTQKIAPIEPPKNIPIFDSNNPQSKEKEVLEMIKFYKLFTSTQSALQKPKTVLERIEAASHFERFHILEILTQNYHAMVDDIPRLLEILIEVNKNVLEYKLSHISADSQMDLIFKQMREQIEKESRKPMVQTETHSQMLATERQTPQNFTPTQLVNKNLVENPHWFSLAEVRKNIQGSASNIQAMWSKLNTSGGFKNEKKEKETKNFNQSLNESRAKSNNRNPEPEFPRSYDDDDSSSSSSSSPRYKRSRKLNVFDSRYK